MKSNDPKKLTEIKVENFEFEPIKGYPMLNWKGKRPFTSTQFYPAQLKESYGKPDADGWMNKIFWGDNLQVMSHLLKEFRGKVDLIYIDPPFDSKADYKRTISIKGKSAFSEGSVFEEKQYRDIWNNDEYLQFIFDRVVLLKELLAPNGSIYVHVGVDVNHYVRCILEEVFGKSGLINEIVWRKSFAHNDPSKCGNIHDSIFYFSKGAERTWNKVFQKPDKDYIETFFDQYDEVRKERYNRLPLDAPRHGDGGNLIYEWKGATPSPGRTWAILKGKMEEYDKQGRIHYPKSGGMPRLKRYESEYEGTILQDLWIDINKIHNQSNEQTGYPTQKPSELIERIILSSSNPNDLVLDCFMGSGTTQSAAMKLGRRFIGADINLGAIQVTTKRLNGQMSNSEQKFAPGLQVYNVNNYDIFRNPLEAKDLIVTALEINPISGTIYDGEKDGRMVKIMPVNRIATRADLTDLITGFDYKTFEKRLKEFPNKPVEKLLIVCMGHEPDLGAFLAKEVSYKLDVEIVDILRNKSNLQFKRESEAKVSINKNKLIIEKFFPMNLLQKLSLQRERISDWKELVESILIDWNYDGAVLEPAIIDVPAKEELVVGEYDVPADAGTIRVKITDLLSESLEIEVTRD